MTPATSFESRIATSSGRRPSSAADRRPPRRPASTRLLWCLLVAGLLLPGSPALADDWSDTRAAALKELEARNLDKAAELLAKAVKLAEAHGIMDARLGTSLADQARLFALQGNSAAAGMALYRARAILDAGGDKGAETLARTWIFEGHMWLDLGDKRAEQAIKSAREKTAAVVGETHPLFGEVRLLEGRAAFEQGRDELAAEALADALTLIKDGAEADREPDALLRVRRALTLLHLTRGDVATALTHADAAIKAAAETRSEERARAHEHRALLRAWRGQWKAAESDLTVGLLLFKGAVGKRNPGLVELLLTRGRIRLLRGDSKAAAADATRAESLCEKAHESRTDLKGRALALKGEATLDSGSTAATILLLGRAQRMLAKASGRRIAHALARVKLAQARLLGRQGRLEDGIQGARKAIEASHAAAGRKAHPDALPARRLIAELALVRHDTATAAAEAKALRAEHKVLFGADAARPGFAELIEARIAVLAGDREAAATRRAAALEKLTAAFGATARPTLAAKALEADVLALSRKLRQGVQVAEAVLAARREALGKSDVDVGRSCYDVARFAFAEKDEERTDSAIREALKILKESLGTRHPEVGLTLSVLGRLAVKRKDDKRADKALGAARKILEAGLPETHAARLPVLEGLYTVARRLRRRDEAKALKEKIKVLKRRMKDGR